MNSAADQLRAAKALIDAPEKWTQGDYARNAEGRAVQVADADAVCFCAVGAVSRTTTAFYGPAIDMLKHASGGDSITTYNDSHSHADIMALFDRAITLAEQEDGDAS